MTRILVTGGRGFLGRALLPQLARPGVELHATTSKAVEATPGIVWHNCDLLQTDMVTSLLRETKPTHLVHLAWVTEHGRYWESPRNTDWLEASIELFARFHEHGGSHVVATGTCAEYQLGVGECREGATPTHPATAYGVAKLKLFSTLAPRAAELGVRFVWARLFHLFGPHETPGRLVPHVIRALLRSEHAECSAGEQLRDYSYVDNVAGNLAALVRSDFAGAVNVASGEPRSVRSVIEAIADRFGRRDLLRLGQAAPRKSDPAVLTADVTRLRNAVGIQPAVDFATALDKTIAWWRQEEAA